jgi:hypothetical protein
MREKQRVNDWTRREGAERTHLTDADTGFMFSSTVLMNLGFMAVVAKKSR